MTHYNDEAYAMISYRCGNGGDEISRLCVFEHQPAIEYLRIPSGISYIQMISPHPMEFDLNWCDTRECPENYMTHYFPNASVKSYQEIMTQFSENLVEQANHREYAMKAIAYNADFAGEKDTKVEDMNFIITSDRYIHAFAANCAILKPVMCGYRRACTHDGQLWMKFTPYSYPLMNI